MYKTMELLINVTASKLKLFKYCSLFKLTSSGSNLGRLRDFLGSHKSCNTVNVSAPSYIALFKTYKMVKNAPSPQV